MCVDVADICGFQFGILQRTSDRQCRAFRRWRDDVAGIGTHSGTGEFGKNGRATCFRVLHVFQHEDRRAFTAIGATGGQNRVPFDTQELSAIEAIAQVGGLATNFADPKGVFILREERAEIANEILGRSDLSGTVRMAYVIDLTEPGGIFNARDFMIRDNDTIYVTEAPYVQWRKTLAAVTGTANSANALTNVTE